MEQSTRDTIHPLTRILSLVVGVIALYLASPVWLVGWAILIGVGFSRHGTWRGLIRALLAGIVFGVLQALNHRPGVPYWDRALTTAVRFALMIMGIAVLYGQGSLLSMLSALEHGIKKLVGRRSAVGYGILMMLLGIAFLPRVVDDVQRIRRDQAMRQSLAGTRRWRPLSFLRPVLVEGFLRSDDVAEALWSRGWRPSGLPPTSRPTWRDGLAVVGWLLVVGMEVHGWPTWR